MKHLVAQWRRVASAVVPGEPGTASVPSGHVRLFHNSRADAATLLREGIRLSRARGQSYGEPNTIWAQAGSPNGLVENFPTTVEFSVHVDDPALGIAGARLTGETYDPARLEDRAAHLTLNRDVAPGEFLAVHEPWHARYRYLDTTSPDLVEVTLEGVREMAAIDPQYRKVLEAWEANH